MIRGRYNHQGKLPHFDLCSGHSIDNGPRFDQHEDRNPRGGGSFFSDQGKGDLLGLRTENVLLSFVEGRGR